jgi:putative transposase
MEVHRSGYYQWLNKPISDRDLDNKKILVHIKEAYTASNGVSGSRNIHKDLQELGIHINKSVLQD